MKKITNLFKSFIKNKKEKILKAVTMCFIFVVLTQTNSYAGIFDGDTSGIGSALELIIRAIGGIFGIRGLLFGFDAYQAWADSKAEGGGQQDNKFRNSITAAIVLLVGCVFIQTKGIELFRQMIGI